MVAHGPAISAAANTRSFQGILKEDERFSSGQNAGTSDAINGSFDRLMLQSGIKTPPTVWLLLCVVLALALGGVVFLITERIFPACLGAAIGVLFPIGVAAVMRSRRQKLIMEQLPGMAEELSRAARTGRNVENSFRMVAADTPSPLGDELRLAARRTDMGLDLSNAIRDLPERTGVATLTMFTSAVSVHQDTGGDLIVVLDRLAASIRDRLHFVNRMRAATIASRLGAVLMIVVPPLVILFHSLRQPGYLDALSTSFWFRLAFWTGVILQCIGAFFVFRILKQSSRF